MTWIRTAVTGGRQLQQGEVGGFDEVGRVAAAGVDPPRRALRPVKVAGAVKER